tara:strand:+ start:1948 stop:2097 length:150 start_codon:yes stop_codon:yes gene_type:complete
MAKEETKKEIIKHSDAYVAYEKLIENYKKQNPVKYETKKAELEKKLSSL